MRQQGSDNRRGQQAGSGQSSGASAPLQATLGAGVTFGDFWQLWRTTTRYAGKEDAAKAWARIPAFQHQKIMKRLRIAIDIDWKGKEISYIPHASTWLNAKRWEDDVPVATSITAEVEPPRPHMTGVIKYPEPTPEERELGKKVLRECVERLSANFAMDKKARIRNLLEGKR